MDEVERVLDQDILTIGFARRFASYKRAYLLLMDPERLEGIIKSESHPVQFIFSGKAHPKDQEGKDLIRQLIRFGRGTNVRHRFIFLENYDPHIARQLVQGTDVWLNTPRRPFEACGTSGMKAALNGVLNVSILDGWWCEGYSEATGWRIGNGEEYSDHEYQDAVESQALYNVLEDDVIPLFYERKNGDSPSGWIKKMKAAMMMAMQRFSSYKMVERYGNRFYLPAEKRLKGLLENKAAEATQLSRQLDRLRIHWEEIRANSPSMHTSDAFHVGTTIHVTADVHLGKLIPDEVDVDLYYGPLKTVETLQSSDTEQMTVKEDRGNGSYVYACDFTLNKTGRYGFTVRITPRGDDWVKVTPNLITWAS
jgi:starch phosphorylase